MRYKKILLATAVAITLLPACAGRSPASNVAQVGPNQHCAPARLPQRLPAPETLIQSAGVRAALTLAELSHGRVVASLSFDSLGAVDRLRIIDAPPSADGTAARDALLPLIQHQESGGWGVRLIINHSDDALRMNVERQRVCVPYPWTRGVARGVLPHGAQHTTRNTVLIDVHVDADGRVLSAKENPQSRNAVVASEVLPLVSTMKFYPGSIDGEPVAAWATIRLP